ncbi:hypothetical protein [Paenirhodobacter populi]|uniref:Uncharacterized protein n=1 Tax=Paenirhodobacter populi TaxID=2306993 RepID=A0A443J653_9RHOB|nr:hypothetical protein [Sinirhodobacter populi]RWR15984.1 hypothetical protein D2T30_22655 [Sinirhodobacter populi]
MLEVLDDATSQALTASGRSDDVQRLATARRQYRDYLAVERAMAGAGEDAAMGIITPTRLRSALSGQGARAYTQGRRGDMGDLARAGAAVLGRPSSSGTVENAGTYLRAGLGVLGTSAAHALGAGPLASSAMGVASAGAPTAINRLMTTGPAQSYLSNQMVSPLNALAGTTPGRISPAASSVLNALLSQP